GTRHASASPEIDDEHDRELEALGRMNSHEIDRVKGVDDGVRFVAERELVEMIGNTDEGRIAAVLNLPHHRAQLLEILARLLIPCAARLESVRGFPQQR